MNVMKKQIVITYTHLAVELPLHVSAFLSRLIVTIVVIF